jgi:long-chain acyl-CoA synthetase
MAEETLPQLLVLNAERLESRPAIRELEKGIWQEFSWRDSLARVRAIALGLRALGFGSEEKLALLSDNRPEAYWAMIAAQAVGGIPVPLYQDAIVREIQYVIDHSDASIVLAEDQEQVDKVLEIRESLPKIRRILYDDPKGMRHYKDPLLMRLRDLEEEGRRLDREHPRLFEELVAQGRGEDVAIICYTSGTTGVPKGAMITHRNMIRAAENFMVRERYHEGDEMLSYLPLAWIGEVAWSLGAALVRGLTVSFPERPETVRANLREIGPHIVLAPPRIWENLLSEVYVRMEDSSRFKRWIFHCLMPLGEEAARLKMEGKAVPLPLRLGCLLGEIFLFGALRDHLGFRRVRHAYTGGAPLGPEIFRFFRGLGINVKQVYGQTENCAFFACQPDDRVKLGTVGLPCATLEVRLSEEGELLSQGDTTFAGYYKDPEATAEAMRGGWLHSGDAAFFDADGHLVVVDRLKDVTRLANGETFAPQYLENKLKFSPYIKEAVVVGQDRPYVGALVNIDMANVGKWAERRQIAYTTYTDLAQKPPVYDLIQREVERVNRDLPESTRIRRYVLLHKELDPDDEEVTRTRKVRRWIVVQKYVSIIEALYSEAAFVPVVAEVTYQDGRRATLETTLRIRSVAEPVALAGATA